jgi:hypothetical protein
MLRTKDGSTQSDISSSTQSNVSSTQSDTISTRHTDTKSIMHSLLEGLTDSADMNEIEYPIFTHKVKNAPRELVTEHPLVLTHEECITRDYKKPHEMSLHQQINALCRKATSFYNMPRVSRSHSDVHIDIPSLDKLREAKEEKDQHSYRKRIQHSLFSFFTILPTDNWKGRVGNVLFWTMQTGASLWNAKNGYEGLYKWYADSSWEKTQGSDGATQALCISAAIFLFWLTQKGIGAGIQHYKLFKTELDGLQKAVSVIVDRLKKLNQTQTTYAKEIDLLKKQVFITDELLKIVVEPVIEQEKCNEQRILTLLQALQNSQVTTDNIESSSSQSRRRLS